MRTVAALLTALALAGCAENNYPLADACKLLNDREFCKEVAELDGPTVKGVYLVDRGRYDEAIAWLDRGLALQPHNEFLISEKIAAFMGAERFDEAYALTQSALNEPALALTLDRPRFLRLAGIVLIDLNRLDDAEATLRGARIADCAFC